jgi:hypothetical protein
MQFSEMQSRVQTLLGESSGDFYTLSEIKDEINDACINIARDTEELLTYSEISTVASTQQYTLPTDFLKLKRVDLVVTSSDVRALYFKTSIEFHNYSEGAADKTGTPEIYKLELGAVSTTNPFPGDIWLYPIPDAVYTLRVYYYQKPSILSNDGDTTELPEQAHKAVCYLAAANMSLKGEDLRKHDRLVLLYERELARLKQHYARLQRQRNYLMQDGMGYTDTEFS